MFEFKIVDAETELTTGASENWDKIARIVEIPQVRQQVDIVKRLVMVFVAISAVAVFHEVENNARAVFACAVMAVRADNVAVFGGGHIESWNENFG